MKNRKLVFIILDGVGVGELPDADAYGDRGANTIGHVATAVGGLELPHLARLGLGNLTAIAGVPKTERADGCYGKMREHSSGKDSTTGHWEIAGILTDRPFPLYPDGFPEHLLTDFLRITGCKGFLGNKPASGTEIIKELGDEHVSSGFPIIYTSGDSVFQIAAHEEIIAVPELYEICKKTREEVMVGEHAVGRVIARPFVGTRGKYSRTPNRKDFALEPPGTTVIELLMQERVETIGIGKIDDLYCGRGLNQKIHTKSNADGIETTLRMARDLKSGFFMTNLVDFDMLFGHRQDPKGFAGALEEFDKALPQIQDCLSDGDLLMITGDHGNDPTDRSTDHTREYVPILCYSISGQKNVDLGLRSSFADAGKTVADFFALGNSNAIAGESFLHLVM